MRTKILKPTSGSNRRPESPETEPRRLFAIVLVLLSAVSATSIANEPGETFTAPGVAELTRAKADVRGAVAGVEMLFVSKPDKLHEWRIYLDWQEQERQLAADPGDPEFWRATYRLLARNHPGLERPEFRAYRAAIRALSDLVETAQHPDPAGEIAASRDELSQMMGGDGQAPQQLDPQQLDRAGELLSLLHRRGGSSDFIEKIREPYSHPNVYVAVSEKCLARLANTEIQRDIVINDFFRGSVVRGNGRFVATQTATLSPNGSDHGFVQLGIRGTTTSDTTSAQQGVSVRTHNVLNFESTAGLLLDKNGITAWPWATSGTLRSDLCNVATDFKFKLRENKARQVVESRRATDRREAEAKAIRDLNRSFDSEIPNLLEPTNRQYQEYVRKPLLRFDRFPSDLHFSAAAAKLQLQCVLADRQELAAPGEPPPLRKDSLVRICVHQSAINNTFGQILNSQNVSLQKAFGQQLVSATKPSSVDVLPETPSLAIQFRESNPISVMFADGHVRVEYSGASYSKQGQRYSGMDIILEYAVEFADGQAVLVQSTDPQVVLPKGPDGTRRRLGVRDYALRRILKNVLERELPARIDLSTGDLPAPFDALTVAAVEAENGWLSVSLEMQP
jgi:hypothetical protein